MLVKDRVQNMCFSISKLCVWTVWEPVVMHRLCTYFSAFAPQIFPQGLLFSVDDILCIGSLILLCISRAPFAGQC